MLICPGQSYVHVAPFILIYANRATIRLTSAQLPDVAICPSAVVFNDPAVVLDNRLIKGRDLFERRRAYRLHQRLRSAIDWTVLNAHDLGSRVQREISDLTRLLIEKCWSRSRTGRRASGRGEVG